MKKIPIFFIFILSISAYCNADTIIDNKGDRFVCNILTKAFRLRTSYGLINIQKDFIKNIIYKDAEKQYLIHSVNNDIFKGFLVNDNIAVDRLYDNKFTIEKMKVRQIFFSIFSGTHEKKTTLFFMKNNDKFSGRVLHEYFELKTSHNDMNIPVDSVNRIEFLGTGGNHANITLKNSSLIKGIIANTNFKINPDSIHSLSIAADKIHMIQFNAARLISKRFEDDSSISFDTDEDGVNDLSDQCPGTPYNASVNEKGCWNISDILFAFNKYDIKPDNYSILKEIIQVLKYNPELKIIIQGHSDNLGKEGYNQQLSLKRANAVKMFFIHNGIKEKRLGIKGFGFNKPKTTNKTDAERALNRRVEIIISP